MKLFILLFLLIPQLAFATVTCGEYRVLSSCGQSMMLVNLVITSHGAYRLDNSCEMDEMPLCHMRDTILRSMIPGKTYCVVGDVHQAHGLGCARYSIKFTRAILPDVE